MRIKAAGKALGVPVPTLRRWTQEFASGLSPEARASDGRPREFSPRDMRVLRRAKEILAGEDMTYDRARRALASDGLLTEEASEAGGNGASGPASRGAASEREAAERFVREVVERQVAPLRDMVSGLVQRVGELEREARALRDGTGRGAPAPGAISGGAARPASPVEGIQEIGDLDRRRGWPFR